MKLIISLLLVVLPILTFAQTTQTYDVVYMKDGRVLYGEILNFEMKDGDITFKDRYGRMYSITREEYRYFIEDKPFKVKQKDTIVNARKFNETEFEIGISAAYYSYNHTFTKDNYFLQSTWNGSAALIPVNIHLGFGKYFKRTFYAGIDADLGVVTSAKQAFQIGLTGRYQYDSHKSNVAKYVSLSLAYQTLVADIGYEVADSIDHNGVMEYPGQIQRDIILRGVNFGVGHGFQFQFLNMRSMNLEINLFKQFGTKGNLVNQDSAHTPSSTFSAFGLRLMLAYHL